MYQVLVLGPCQVAGPAPLVSAVTQYAACHPSLLVMMAVMALTTAWTIALLVCQLYQVNMGCGYYFAPNCLHTQLLLLRASKKLHKSTKQCKKY